MTDAQTTITYEAIRREVLERVAAKTRHKPAALDGKFHMEMVAKADTVELRAAIGEGGKYQASKEFGAEALSWSLDRFSAEIAQPLAADLLASGGR